MSKSLLLFVFLLSCLIKPCFGNEDNAYEINDQVIEYLIETKDPTVIPSDDGSKIYLDSEKIVSRKNGLFFQTQNGDTFRIPFLFSNQKGCYILSSNHLDNSVIYPVIRCKGCGLPFSPNIFNK